MFQNFPIYKRDFVLKDVMEKPEDQRANHLLFVAVLQRNRSYQALKCSMFKLQEIFNTETISQIIFTELMV